MMKGKKRCFSTDVASGLRGRDFGRLLRIMPLKLTYALRSRHIPYVIALPYTSYKLAPIFIPSSDFWAMHTSPVLEFIGRSKDNA
jgi:hypothetical protein